MLWLFSDFQATKKIEEKKKKTRKYPQTSQKNQAKQAKKRSWGQNVHRT